MRGTRSQITIHGGTAQRGLRFPTLLSFRLITEFSAPEIEDIDDIVITEEEAFSFTPTVIGTEGFDIVYSIIGTLPVGLSIDSATGEISGTPPDPEVQAGLQIRLTYSSDSTSGYVDSNVFSITVLAVDEIAAEFGGFAFGELEFGGDEF